MASRMLRRCINEYRMKIVILNGAITFAKRRQLRSRKPALSEAEGDPYGLSRCALPRGVLTGASAAESRRSEETPGEAGSDAELQGILRLHRLALCATLLRSG